MYWPIRCYHKFIKDKVMYGIDYLTDLLSSKYKILLMTPMFLDKISVI